MTKTRKNPIAPFEKTPQGIREYQANQPFPDIEAKREQLLKFYVNKFLTNASISNDDFSNLVYSSVEKDLTKYIQVGTTLPWSVTRNLIYIRDEGICDICGDKIPFEFYECGHIVDRVCGGSDRLENLVCMCNYCNRLVKDLHETKEEYFQWKSRFRKVHQS